MRKHSTSERRSDLFDDKGHKPDAVHEHMAPSYQVDRGPEAIRVRLQAWGPELGLFQTLYNRISASWGDEAEELGPTDMLTPEQMNVVESAFQGKTLPQVLEMISLTFLIDGVTRACTHQIVRTRIGASFSQHGGRNNDWRHRNWTQPETMRQLFIHRKDLRRRLHDHLAENRQLYADFMDAGIPAQDARRILFIGTQTFVFASYTFPALKGFLANRLEHTMDWEINCVAQLMQREITMYCPRMLSAYLGSHSDLQQRGALAGMDLFPPDEKWPTETEGRDYRYPGSANPFWVLDPRSMAGAPVRWIRSEDGKFPHDRYQEALKEVQGPKQLPLPGVE